MCVGCMVVIRVKGLLVVCFLRVLSWVCEGWMMGGGVKVVRLYLVWFIWLRVMMKWV